MITQPSAKKLSYLLIFFEIVTGISKTPGTLITLIKLDFGIKFIALLSKPIDISVESKKPIGNGIITCLNMKQAQARKKKGREAAQAVISVLSQK